MTELHNSNTPLYPNAGRTQHPQDTVIDVCGIKIGGGHFAVIAGPCTVESEEQIMTVAQSVKAAGASFLRGGAFKPRTSPYAFQGLGKEGLRLLLRARETYGLPIVTEILDADQLPLFADVDVIQVGARNMQNYALLRKLGKLDKPILLKRGFSATTEDLLRSADCILAGGNGKVILCERGIRAAGMAARTAPDIAAIPMLKDASHLPVIADPSHATGDARLVPPVALAATAAGADGLIIEVHNDPAHALCDGVQSLTPETFALLCRRIARLLPVCRGDA